MKRNYYIIALAMAASFSISASASNSSSISASGKNVVIEMQHMNNKSASIVIYNYKSLSGSSIVNAARRIRGVKFANWNRSSHSLRVVYNSNVVSLSQIRSALARQGYQLDVVKHHGDKYNGMKNHGAHNNGMHNNGMHNNGANNHGAKNNGSFGHGSKNGNGKVSNDSKGKSGGIGKQGGRK